MLRVHYADEIEALHWNGSLRFVHPEFEAGLRFAHHVLSAYGLPSQDCVDRLDARRVKHYEG